MLLDLDNGNCKTSRTVPAFPKMENTMTYALTRIKTFLGNEGHGLNAVITRDGKPVAFVLDDAWGGEVQYDFTNPLQNPKSYKASHANADKEERLFEDFVLAWIADRPEDQADLDKHIKTVRSYSPGLIEHKARARYAADRWVAMIVDAHQEQKRMKRLCAKKVLFRKPDEKYAHGEYHTLKAPFEPKAKEYLVKKYGPSVYILNEHI